MSGECIYNVVADAIVPAAEPQNKVRRKKGYSQKVPPPPTASSFGLHGTSAILGNAGGEFTDPSVHPTTKPIGSFGRNVGCTVDPSNFLKKNEGPFTASRGAPMTNRTNFKKSECVHVKLRPAIPDRHERPVMGLKTDKNFVVANAVENTLAIPTKQIPVAELRPVDREDFGKVPTYLQEIKKEIQDRREMLETLEAKAEAANERWSELSSEELAQLRTGLQRRWNVVNKEYQSKGFSKSQTPSQKLYQEALENELRAVEFVMQKLSRQHIFVYDDQK